MSAPLLWIILPGLIALLLFLLRRWENAVIVAGLLAVLFLAVSAWQFRIDAPIVLGPVSIKLSETMVILGRRFELADQNRPLLIFIYSVSAFWFAGVYFSRPGSLFVPLGLGMVALLTASLAVTPFLFAALFIAITVLLSIPLLVPPGSQAGSGPLRYLTYQILGVPFILFTGWMLAGVEASPGDLELVLRASVLLGFGFAFLLGIVPFHIWIPMIARQVHPYVAGFIFVMLLGMISLFALGFLDRFIWLRESPVIFLILRYAGLLMVAVGGISTAFEKDLARLLAFTVIIDGGLSLLALSLASQEGFLIYFALFSLRVVGFLIWAVALTAQNTIYGGASQAQLSGAFWKTPALLGGLLFSLFSFAAIPLLPGFPPRVRLWDALAVESPGMALLATVGSLGLMVAGIRILRISTRATDDLEEKPRLGAGLTTFFILGMGLLIFFGLFPQTLDFIASNLVDAFPNLSALN